MKLPTAYLLGPIIGTAALVIAGVPAPDLPAPILDIAQITMGAYLGLTLKPADIKEKRKMMLAAAATGFSLILFSMAAAFVLTSLHGVPYLTAFIALAPGGMDQMGILAQEARASLAIVTSYQMFRIFFHPVRRPASAEKTVRYPLVSTNRTLANAARRIRMATMAIAAEKVGAVISDKHMLN
nr:AbrB family transcriptional regulator [Geobacillus subterraneus]